MQFVLKSIPRPTVILVHFKPFFSVINSRDTTAYHVYDYIFLVKDYKKAPIARRFELLLITHIFIINVMKRILLLNK
ncbi:hypothetical protein PMSM_20930 [Paenibacillus macquariensis subsp. macquariensis]|nr:hypothetical protein PMSM_20930 [Paenibacillus macquariensis subsp. macquariensis]